ncbi:MAG: DUF1800 domain-containing protein [Chitinophagaceae bacterium]|nr:MAG: DUF1800 domain-containing protein [Chitinophagaceae bacterium]
MDRRDFLTGRKRTDSSSPLPQPGIRQIFSDLTPYAGTWSFHQVVHLLKRTMFGAKLSDIQYFTGLTMTQAVDELLTVSATPPAPPIKTYSNDGVPASDLDYGVAVGDTWVNAWSGNGTVNSRRTGSWKSWWTGLMIHQERTIQEKMVLFWHNHFATEANEYARGTFGYRHNALLRADCLGNFKTLVRDVTLDAAMLRYLNGYLNTNTAPDENYARELQELFTLGKENNPNYEEDDVKAAARVLTGWRIDSATDTVFFDVNRHDKNSKIFSSFYSGQVIAGKSDATAGDAELDDLLNMIFNKNIEVSEFIVKRLYLWFCYYTIDSNTMETVIRPLAQLLRDSNWEIKPVLAALLKSEHFFDALNQGCLIKSPIDITVSTIREFNVAMPAQNDYVNAYYMYDYVRSQAAIMQQNLGDPPSVSGWPPYYQVPQFYEIWINSDTLPKRNRFTDQLILTGYSRNGQKIQIDPVAFAASLPNPADPNALLSDSLNILYRVPLSENSRNIIKRQILLSSQEQDYYWSNAWNAYRASPSNMTSYQIVYNRLRDLYKYLMNLAEFQLS